MLTASACCGASRSPTKSSRSAVISGGGNDRKEKGLVHSGDHRGLCRVSVHRGGRWGVAERCARRRPAKSESVRGPERRNRRGKSNFCGSLRKVPRRRRHRPKEKAESSHRSRAEGDRRRNFLAA